MPAPTRADWISILFLGLVWGGTFMVISLALRGYGPVTVACARTTLGALAVLGLMRATGRSLPHAAAVWRSAVPIGLLSTAIPFFLLSWGQQSLPSAFAGLSMASVPLFVLPLAHVFSDEKLSLRKATGFGLGFAGVLVLLGPEAFGGDDGAVLAWLACIASALCYAISSILTRRCPPVDPVSLAAATLIIGAVVLIPAMLVAEGVPHWAGPVPGLAIIFLGLVPTALAALLRVTVIRSAGSGFMTLTNYQVPLWSMAFGTLILGESLPHSFFTALMFILIGLAISQSGRRRG